MCLDFDVSERRLRLVPQLKTRSPVRKVPRTDDFAEQRTRSTRRNPRSKLSEALSTGIHATIGQSGQGAGIREQLVIRNQCGRTHHARPDSQLPWGSPSGLGSPRPLQACTLGVPRSQGSPSTSPRAPRAQPRVKPCAAAVAVRHQSKGRSVAGTAHSSVTSSS